MSIEVFFSFKKCLRLFTMYSTCKECNKQIRKLAVHTRLYQREGTLTLDCRKMIQHKRRKLWPRILFQIITNWFRSNFKENIQVKLF